jgi:hypothetical protein
VPGVPGCAPAPTAPELASFLSSELFVLLKAGLRIGEALGTRHEDIDIGGCLVHVVPRDNANGMRAKGGRGRRFGLRLRQPVGRSHRPPGDLPGSLEHRTPASSPGTACCAAGPGSTSAACRGHRLGSRVPP